MYGVYDNICKSATEMLLYIGDCLFTVYWRLSDIVI